MVMTASKFGVQTINHRGKGLLSHHWSLIIVRKSFGNRRRKQNTNPLWSYTCSNSRRIENTKFNGTKTSTYTWKYGTMILPARQMKIFYYWQNIVDCTFNFYDVCWNFSSHFEGYHLVCENPLLTTETFERNHIFVISTWWHDGKWKLINRI